MGSLDIEAATVTEQSVIPAQAGIQSKNVIRLGPGMQRDGISISHFIVALLLSACSACAAADWLQVEVIAFRYPLAKDSSWAAAHEVPDFSGAQRLGVPGASTAVGELAYVALSPSELQLAGAEQALERSNYQVLIHSGWRQTATDSRPVYLATPPADVDPAVPTSVEGVVRLAVAARAMRISANFIVHLPEAPIAISETRTVSAGDLQYFDHPLLGLLVEVTRLIDEDGKPQVRRPGEPRIAVRGRRRDPVQ